MKNSTSWIKGQSGNLNGRPRKGESITDILKKKLEEYVDTAAGRVPYKEALVNNIIKTAIDGDDKARKVILDYIEGTPVQNTNINVNNPIVDMIKSVTGYNESIE